MSRGNMECSLMVISASLRSQDASHEAAQTVVGQLELDENYSIALGFVGCSLDAQCSVFQAVRACWRFYGTIPSTRDVVWRQDDVLIEHLQLLSMVLTFRITGLTVGMSSFASTARPRLSVTWYWQSF